MFFFFPDFKDVPPGFTPVRPFLIVVVGGEVVGFFFFVVVFFWGGGGARESFCLTN